MIFGIFGKFPIGIGNQKISIGFFFADEKSKQKITGKKSVRKLFFGGRFFWSNIFWSKHFLVEQKKLVEKKKDRKKLIEKKIDFL